MIRIFIADDHAIVRQGIKQLIREEYSQAEFGEAVNGCETLEKLQTEKWDVIIMDVSMPLKNGVEVLKQIRREHIDTPVLMLSFHSEEQYAPMSAKAGANAYLEKGNLSEDLLNTLSKLLKTPI